MNQLQVSNFANCFALSIGGLFIFLSSSIFAQNQRKTPYQGKTADIFISEICHVGNSNLNFIEIYNPTDSDINLSSGNYYLSRDNISSVSDVALSGTIGANSTFICSVPYSWFIITWKWFLWEYGLDPDQQSTDWIINSSSSFMIYKGGDSSTGELIDIYGKLGNDYSGQDWDYSNAHSVRKRNISSPNSDWNQDEWVIIEGGSDQMSPGQHKTDLTYNASSGSWNTKANWSGMGYVPDASCNVEIVSGKSITIDASSACNQLKIYSDAVVNIEAGKDLQVVDSIINLSGSNGLILNSDASGCSSLIHYSDGTSAFIQSYFPDLNKWYLVASPIMDATAGVFYNQFLDYWCEPEESWKSIEDENFILSPGTGYSVKKTGSNFADFEGTLNNGIVLIDSLRYTEGNSPDLRGWNLIGNPYPSVLDFFQVDLSGKFINAGISVWPHNGTESSSYISWSQGGGAPVGNVEARYVQPGQGFMIQISEDLESFELNNSCRTHVGLGCFDKSINRGTNQEETIVFEIQGQNSTKDRTYLAIREGASLKFDLQYDVRKIFGSSVNPHVFFFSGMADEEKLSINCIDPPDPGDSHYLGLQIGTEGDYTLRINGISTLNEEYIFLFDEITEAIYDLKTDSIIDFYWTKEEPEKRFKIMFDEYVPINNIHLKTSKYLTYVRDSRLYFSGRDLEGNELQIQIFNLLGQKVKEQCVLQPEDGIQLDLASGYYWVSILDNDKKFVTSFYMPSNGFD